MINVDHPNIIKIYKYFNEWDFLYIVMECCYGGELFEKEITLSENNLAILAKKILTAINYCHKKNIVHRDLKPENILYTSKEKNADIKIVDWGLSCFYKLGFFFFFLLNIANCFFFNFYSLFFLLIIFLFTFFFIIYHFLFIFLFIYYLFINFFFSILFTFYSFFFYFINFLLTFFFFSILLTFYSFFLFILLTVFFFLKKIKGKTNQ